MEGDMNWDEHSSADPKLFAALRSLQDAEIYVRFAMGVGDGSQVEVPAAVLSVQGRFRVEPRSDRFCMKVPEWGEEHFVYFARRKGRGRDDYWQGAIEHRPEGRPSLVLYFTAPLDGLIIRTRATGRRVLSCSRDSNGRTDDRG